MVISGNNLEGVFSMEDGRGREMVDLPFRMLVIGDWSGNADKKDLSTRRPVEVDRDNFDEVLARFAPSLVLDINDDPLVLSFSELDDFHPDHIFQNVGIFSELRDLRRRLKDTTSFDDAARDVRTRFGQRSAATEMSAAPEATVPNGPEDLLSQILTQPGGSAPRPQKASGELAGFISELVRPHLVRVDEDEQSRLVAAVDSATRGLMQKILHDHKFQALEAAWRGLYFLVRRADTDRDLKIFVLDISKDELADNLKRGSDLTNSFFYKTLISDTIETFGEDRWSAVIGNYGFLPDVEDIAALVRISKICAAADAPFVSHMRADVLGVRDLEGHTDPRDWDLSGTTDEGKLWSTLRSMPESVYLGMTMPRFLGRLPYGADSDPLEAFNFEEFDNPPDHNNYLWINACFACAVLLAQSFSESGWEMGIRFVQDLDGLPLFSYEADGQTVYQPCAEVQLTHDGCDKLMEYGLMPLVTYKNTDRVQLTRFQSITDPVTALRGKWKRG